MRLLALLSTSFCLVSAFTLSRYLTEDKDTSTHSRRQLNANPLHEREREGDRPKDLYLIYDEQSFALYKLTEQFKRLTRYGKLNIVEFDEHMDAWANRLARIEEAAEGTLRTRFSLEAPITFFKKHFEMVKSANLLRKRLLRSFTGKLGVSQLDELISIYTDIYKLYNLHGVVNTWFPHIDSKVTSLTLALDRLNATVNAQNGLPRAVRTFYDSYAPDVRYSLDFAITQLERKRKDDQMAYMMS